MIIERPFCVFMESLGNNYTNINIKALKTVLNMRFSDFFYLSLPDKFWTCSSVKVKYKIIT